MCCKDSSTRGYLVTALVKLVGQHNLKSASVNRVIRSQIDSHRSRMKQLTWQCAPIKQLSGADPVVHTP
eukprot:4918378-Amphidinium_carterae.1